MAVLASFPKLKNRILVDKLSLDVFGNFPLQVPYGINSTRLKQLLSLGEKWIGDPGG